MSIVKQLLGEGEKKTASVTITVTGDCAQSFVEFANKLQKLCNQGSSRTLGILDPSDEGEKEVKWSFDGDGDTRIDVT